MKVLVIPSWYPIGEDKLMGIYHKYFTEALNKFGVEANILHIDRQRLSKPFNYLFMKKNIIIKESNYNVYLYKMLNVEKISYDWQMKLYVKKMLNSFKIYLKTNEKPDIIHAQVSLPAGYAATILGKKYNIPVIITEHYSKYESFFELPKYKKYSDFILKNSFFSTVSNYMKNTMIKYTKECFVIPNIVDVNYFHNNIKRNINNDFNLVIISALRKGKNIDVVFKAIKILIEKEKINIHLDIIGDGFCENYFKQVCDELELNDYVTFLGRKSKQEIAIILKKEHALIISSELETFAIPGIEAMASGLPVISTKCQGPEEYIDDLSGVLCEVNDPEDMAKAILELYNNYDKYDSNYIKSIANNFSKEVVINRCKKIYEKIKCR